MVSYQDIQYEFQNIANEIGTNIRIRYYALTFSGTEYDSTGYLSQVGSDVYTSGIIQPVGGKYSSEDWKFLEQGRILINDSKLYINGSVNITPVSGTVKIGIGSPVTKEMYITDAGVNAWNINNVIAYQRAYVRCLNNGSFANEI